MLFTQGFCWDKWPASLSFVHRWSSNTNCPSTRKQRKNSRLRFYVLGCKNHWFMYEAANFVFGISNWKANSSAYCADLSQIHSLLWNILICFGNNFITFHMWSTNWLHEHYANFYEKAFITVDQIMITKSCKLCLWNFSQKWWVLMQHLLQTRMSREPKRYSGNYFHQLWQLYMRSLTYLEQTSKIVELQEYKACFWSEIFSRTW